MDESTLAGDAFAVPDLWRKSTLAEFEDDAPPVEAETLLLLSQQPLP